MVTLVPIDHRDGLEAAGLYLTRPEFDEIVNVRKYSFHPACLDFIFKISSGHAGAMDNVFNNISRDDVSLPTFVRITGPDVTSQSYRKITASQKSFTISDFFQHFTPHRLYAGLQVSFGEISLTMMRFRSQRWLAFYALLSVTMSSWMRHSQKQRRARR